MLVRIVGLIIYCLIGVTVNSIINDDREAFSIIAIILWPLIVIMLFLFYIMGLCVKLGRYIRKITKGRR